MVGQRPLVVDGVWRALVMQGVWRVERVGGQGVRLLRLLVVAAAGPGLQVTVPAAPGVGG